MNKRTSLLRSRAALLPRAAATRAATRHAVYMLVDTSGTYAAGGRQGAG